MEHLTKAKESLRDAIRAISQYDAPIADKWLVSLVKVAAEVSREESEKRVVENRGSTA